MIEERTKELSVEKRDLHSAALACSTRSSLNRDMTQLQTIWRRGSLDTARLLAAVLIQLTPETREEACLLGNFIRYRAGADEWEVIVKEYLESQSCEKAKMLSVVLGHGHVPLIRDLMTAGFESLAQFMRDFQLLDVTSVLAALGFFVTTGGLQDLSGEQRAAARQLFLAFLERLPGNREKLPSRTKREHEPTPGDRNLRSSFYAKWGIGHKKFKRQFAYKLPIIGLEQIGSRDDFQRLVPHINRMGSRWGAYVIRLVLPYRPRGLRRQLEEAIATQKRPWILATALAALMNLTGFRAEPVVRDFLRQDPERNRSIVAMALRKMYPVKYFGEKWTQRLAELEGAFGPQGGN